MKVLHISSSDTMGGAAHSAMNLHTAFLESGVNSVFFAAEKQRKNARGIISFKNGYVMRRVLAILDELPSRLYPKRDKRFTFTNNWFPVHSIIRAIENEKPDVVHIHWIGKGIMRIEHLGKIKIPVVWTMHDNYVFTGGCHLVNTCTRFLTHCGECPALGSEKKHDLSTKNFYRKKRAFDRSDITFIAPSRWMFEMAKNSALLKQRKVKHLPNLINTEHYFPVDKSLSKKGFGINEGVKVVLFGAFNSTGDVNKGFNELLSALNSTSGDLNIVLFVFGAEKPEMEPLSRFPVKYLGYLSDTVSKRFLYSAADVTVVPSRIENLSNVIMESMACATPVVAFRTGGNSDLIDHKINGFLAEKEDINGLSAGIKWIINHDKQDVLQSEADKKIRTVFNKDVVLSRHLDLYNSLVHER